MSNLLSPISIKFNFSQADNETAATTLNVDSKRQSVVEVRTVAKHYTMKLNVKWIGTYIVLFYSTLNTDSCTSGSGYWAGGGITWANGTLGSWVA